MLSRTTFYEDYQRQILKIEINGTPLGILMRMFIALDKNKEVNEMLPTTLLYLMPSFLDSRQHDVIDFLFSLLNEIEKVICLFGHCIEVMHFYQHMITRINKEIEREICHKKYAINAKIPFYYYRSQMKNVHLKMSLNITSEKKWLTMNVKAVVRLHCHVFGIQL